MRGAGRLYLIAIGLLLCAAGAVFIWLMWRSYDRAAAQRAWAEIECQMEESGIAMRQISADVRPEYSFSVFYVYQYEGQGYSSKRYSLRGSAWSSDEARAQKLVDKFPEGEASTCFVDPADPESAVLKLDSRAAGYSLWFPCIILVGGLGIIIGALRSSPPKSKAAPSM